MSKNSLCWEGGTRTPKVERRQIYSLLSQPIAQLPIVAEDVGFEPTVHCCTLVFKTSAFDHSANLPILVNPTGFEPVTVCLEGRCSIQLSYESYTLCPGPGSNRHGHYCPQDFKSGVSTNSTTGAYLLN